MGLELVSIELDDPFGNDDVSKPVGAAGENYIQNCLVEIAQSRLTLVLYFPSR